MTDRPPVSSPGTSVRLTWGQLKSVAESLGLADDDPEPSAAMLIAALEACTVINAEAAMIDLYGLEGSEDDGAAG